MFSQMHPFYRALERHFQMSGSHSFAVLLGSMYPWSFPSSSPYFFGQPSIQSPLHHINGRVFFLIKPDNYISFSNFISFPLAISSLGFSSLHDDTWTFQSLTRYLFSSTTSSLCHSKVQWHLSSQRCKTYFDEVSNKTAMASCSIWCQEYNIKRIIVITSGGCQAERSASELRKKRISSSFYILPRNGSCPGNLDWL